MPEHFFGKIVEKLTAKNEKGQEYLDIGKFLEELGFTELKNQVAPNLDYLSVSQKAEIMWALYRDLQKETWRSPIIEKKYKIKKKAGDAEEKTVESKTQKLQRKKDLAMRAAILMSLWRDVEVKSFFQQEYNRHLQESKNVNGEYEQYQLLTKEISRLEKKLDETTADLFRGRNKKTDELAIVMRAVAARELDERRIKLAALLEEHPELAARAAYDRLVSYRKELEDEHFVWLPSRRKLLEQLGEKILTGRPVMLLSESGAGKTSIVSAAAKKFTGEKVSRSVGGQYTRAEKLFATRELSGDASFYLYQPIMEAMSGKKSEKDSEPSHAGKFYLDDEFNQRPTEVQMEIVKSLSGHIYPGEKFQIPNTTVTEKVQPNFAFIAAGNPPTDRYERKDTDVAVQREFGGNILEVDYLAQTKDNPELYQLLLVALMDKNGRLRASKQELSPAFKKENGQEVIDEAAMAGGFLWRFANAWRTMLDGFSHRENAFTKANPGQPKEDLFFDKLLLDVGVVISWIEAYKKTKQGELSLDEYLKKQLRDFLGQPTIPQEDRNIAEKMLKYFGIDLNKKEIGSDEKKQSLTPQDIGWLSPNVPRPREGIAQARTFEILSEDGDTIEYEEKTVGKYKPGTTWRMKGSEEVYVFRGVSKNGGAVFELNGIGVIRGGK